MIAMQGNGILGIPFSPITRKNSPWRPYRTRKRVSVGHQLHTFLAGEILNWQPDLIVVIERKGTAILRALKEWNEDPFNWPWSKVVSSDIIDQVPDDHIAGKRILVFDDTMNTGAHVRDILAKLHKRAAVREVRLAVFATHEHTSRTADDILIPDAWFYRSLTRTSYHAICGQIVNMLQEAGSLMLDTEHIEVRLQLTGSFRGFVDALRRTSHSVVFRSSQGRTNVTVVYEDDEPHQLAANFPRNTWTQGIVKKCRIVQRNNPDEYAIIPICFPSTPLENSSWDLDDKDRALLGQNSRGDYKTRFYDVGLLAALEVLRWVLKDLAVWGNDNYILSLPQEIADDAYGYDLQHLRAMYPTLNIGGLVERIAEIAHDSEREGSELRDLKFEPKDTKEYPDEELRRDSALLLGAMRHVLDRRTVGRGWTEGWKNFEWDAMPLHEITALAKQFRWERYRLSTLFDILIDEATLSTDIGPFSCKDGIQRVTRTFSPAGEVVSDLVRRYITQWGLPRGV